MTVRVHLCCPDPPAGAIAEVIASAEGVIAGTSAVLDDLLRQDLDCDVLALASITPGSMPTAMAVSRVRATWPRVRVILLLDAPNEALTDEAMKAGVYDWTVGDSLSHELPGLLRQPRSYADVVGNVASPPAAPSVEFASGEVRKIALGFGAKYVPMVERLLETSHAGEFTIAARAETFEDLVRFMTPDIDGVLTISNLPSAGGFDLETRVRLLAGAARRAQVAVLLLPTDLPSADALLEQAGLLALRGETRAEGRVSFPSTVVDPLFRRMSQATRKLAGVPVRDEPVGRPIWREPVRASQAGVGVVGTSVPGGGTISVPVPSRVIGVFSAATGVGKTNVALNVAILAGRLGITSLLLDLSTLPPGNAALRLGFPLSDQPGLEALLQGEWDDDFYLRLKLRYEDTQTYTLRPISERVLGTLRDARPGAFERLIEFSRAQYALTVIDTSPVLDDESVLVALDRADKALYVIDATDDRVEQSVARLSWVQHSMSDPSRLTIVINKVGPGGWAPADILDRLGMPDAQAIVLPSEEVRHRRALMAHRPIAMDVGPQDPWAKLFVTVAGDLVSLDRRKRWVDRPTPAPRRGGPDRRKADVSHETSGDRGLARIVRWLASSSDRAQL